MEKSQALHSLICVVIESGPAPRRHGKAPTSHSTTLCGGRLDCLTRETSAWPHLHPLGNYQVWVRSLEESSEVTFSTCQVPGIRAPVPHGLTRRQGDIPFPLMLLLLLPHPEGREAGCLEPFGGRHGPPSSCHSFGNRKPLCSGVTCPCLLGAMWLRGRGPAKRQCRLIPAPPLLSWLLPPGGRGRGMGRKDRTGPSGHRTGVGQEVQSIPPSCAEDHP